MPAIPTPTPSHYRIQNTSTSRLGEFKAGEADAILNHQLEATQIVPVSAIAWQCEENWTQPPRRLRDTMWYWIEQGTGSAWIGSPADQTTFGPGDLLMIPKAISHRVWPDEGVRIQTHTVHFQANIYGVIDLLSLLGIAGVFPPGHDAPFESASKALAREFASALPGQIWAMESHIKRVLLYLIRHRMGSGDLPDSHTRKGLIRLQPVFELIEERLADPALKVADLAEAIFVSEVYLRRLFRNASLASPTEFICRRRIDRACMLLRTTTLEIKTIATRCGFRDTPFFHRMFKKFVKKTPLKYRRTEDI